MLFSEDSYRYMYAALQEAQKAFDDDEVPVGAVVVHKNRIIGRGYNQVEKLKDATAPVSYTHLRAHETVLDLVCRLLLEKKK